MRHLLFLVVLSVLLFAFAYGETQVLGTSSTVRKLARRSRGLIRRIEHRATGRRLHARTRGTLRRLFKRLHGMLRVVRVKHGKSKTIAERKRWIKLMMTIAKRLSTIRDKLKVKQLENVHVQPVVNVNGQVNLTELRNAYLKKMRSAIVALQARYKVIIGKFQTALKNANSDDVKDALKKLKIRVKLIKDKLKNVKKQFVAAKAQVKREKAQTNELRKKIKVTKAEARKTIRELKDLIRKLRKQNKSIADKAQLVETIKRLKKDIRDVHESVRSKLDSHRRELSRKIRELHEQWSKKREELEDAWEEKKDAMRAAWAKERKEYVDEIARLKKRFGKCRSDEIYNIRIKKCVKLYQNTVAPTKPKRPTPSTPKNGKYTEFNKSLKQTKDTVKKMTSALKKMAEKERS